jgi:Uma2 family endonuclease
MVADPVLIVEVLSPSTSQVDRFRKLADYRALASVQEILVVFADERRAQLQRHGADGWRVEDLIGQAALTLACCTSPIPLDALYAGPMPEP